MHTSRGFDRLVNFSDAVVAIAITLLILPLVESVVEFDGDVSVFVLSNLYQIFVFFLSFVVIGNFWMVHHRLYEKVTDYSTPLIWANLLWLLSIVFLPFPTELLANAEPHDKATYALYIGTMVVTTAATLLQQVIIVRAPNLQNEIARGTIRLLPAVTTTALMIVSGVLAVFTPIGLWALLLLIFAGPLDSLIDRLSRKKPA